MRRNSTIEMTEAQYNNNVCAIRDKLKETKMTIGQLSARSGVSKSLVCDILNERLIGSPPTWKKIAETLDIKFEYKDLSKKAARERAREKEENDKNSYGILCLKEKEIRMFRIRPCAVTGRAPSSKKRRNMASMSR